MNKLKIGEFSRLCKVTVRTLRHYEEIGLLVPDVVDSWTGYRYYAVAQLQKMLDIIELKSLGFSLEEIRDLYDDSNHKPAIKSLEAKILQCEAELRKLNARKAQLEAIVNYQKEIDKMENITIQSLPEIIVASHRATIPSYDDLGMLCYQVIGPEMARLGCECPEPGYCYSIEHGGYKPENIDVEYCEMVTEAKEDSALIKFKKIPAVPAAVCMKAYGPYDRLPQAYIDVFAWMEANGWEIAGSPRACYVDGIWNQEDPQKWLTIIQVPGNKLR